MLNALRSAYESVIDVGSGVVTSIVSGLATRNSITAGDIPAPVSIIITSAIPSSSESLLTSLLTCSLSRLTSFAIPEPPDMNLIPSGPSVIISSSSLPANIRSLRLYLGITPNITSILASPKSASSIITFFPILVNCTARLIEVLDLPTPPFPLVTAITREFVMFFKFCFLIILRRFSA